MFNIAICDDEISASAEIEKLLLEICKKNLVRAKIDIFYDGNKLVKLVQQGERYDLLYLDIKMGMFDGIKTAKEIRKTDQNVLIIYVSSYDEYAKSLFSVEPFRFIDKPIEPEVFEKIFQKACFRVFSKENYFQFRYNKETYKILVSEIIYFESNRRKICVHIRNGEDLYFYGKLNEIERTLELIRTRFLRIHQSFLVNLQYIRKLTFSWVELVDGTVLQISEERQKLIRNKYCEYAGGEIID